MGWSMNEEAQVTRRGPTDVKRLNEAYTASQQFID